MYFTTFITCRLCYRDYEKSGNWSEEGVTVLNATQDRVVCESNHLTSFAVLAEVSEVRFVCMCIMHQIYCII